MKILKDISELLDAGVITNETADNIQNYYKGKNKSSGNKLLSVFAILGSILIGLGIILIIAHNWSQLPKIFKLLFAFVPLLVAQSLCFYVLLKKNENLTWRESTATFLILSVGACIALVSQTYHIEGGLQSFLLIWLLLSLPVIYFMRSFFSSLIYIFLTTVYACSLAEFYVNKNYYRYWLLFFLLIPYIFYLYKKHHRSNFIFFHNWLIPLSLTITLGMTVSQGRSYFIYMAYVSLFGLFYIIGTFNYFLKGSSKANGYKIIGHIGTMYMLLMLSFEWLWKRLSYRGGFTELFSIQLFAALLITILALVLLYIQKKRGVIGFDVFKFIFIIFIITFFMGFTLPHLSLLLMNIYIFGIGLIKITQGIKKENLSELNYGLFIMAILIICRFFDTQISFVLKGTLFIFVGIGFLISNYYILKKRKHE